MKLFLGILLGSVMAVFIVQNTEVTEVRFLIWSLSMSRALMFLLILLFGVVLGWLWHTHAVHRRHSRSPDTGS